MLIVSDASPLLALARLGLVEILASLYGEVVIPPTVAEEGAHGPPGLPVLDVSALPFLKVVAPSDPGRVEGFLPGTGPRGVRGPGGGDRTRRGSAPDR